MRFRAFPSITTFEWVQHDELDEEIETERGRRRAPDPEHPRRNLARVARAGVRGPFSAARIAHRIAYTARYPENRW